MLAKAKMLRRYFRHFDVFLSSAWLAALLLSQSGPKIRIMAWGACACALCAFVAGCLSVRAERETSRREAGMNGKPD